MPKVEVNDIEMYYEIHGEGEPLVLLHGFGVTGASLHSLIPEYKKHFKLIIPDLRGRGHSTNPTTKFTHKQSASDIFELLEHLNVERFNALGSSTGGMILLHISTQQPDRIHKMILASASPYLTKEARAIQAQMTPENVTEERMKFMRSVHHLGDEQIMKIGEEWHNQKDNYDDVNFTPPYLSRIKANTLILHGDNDEFFPVHIPVQMHKHIPDSYLCILPNNPHSIFSERHGGTARKIVLDFLLDNWET